MKDPVLVILAAGMGSRYGGLKQIEAVGSQNESIIDFSIYDAIKAGFKKVYLIIQRQHHQAFEEQLGRKIRPFIEVEYVYQDSNKLPGNYQRSKDRVKPWGTTHALLACKGIVDGPFAIINADDYYGTQSFQMIYQFLKNEVATNKYGIVAFETAKTVSENGSVTRAICSAENQMMTSIVEIQKIFKQDNKIYYQEGEDILPLIGNEPVSMNYWGFDGSIFDLAEANFIQFMDNEFESDPLKCELVIPTTIRDLLSQSKITVKMMTSEDTWFGVTYKDDKPLVVEALNLKKEQGVYPENLWEEKK